MYSLSSYFSRRLPIHSTLPRAPASLTRQLIVGVVRLKVRSLARTVSMSLSKFSPQPASAVRKSDQDETRGQAQLRTPCKSERAPSFASGAGGARSIGQGATVAYFAERGLRLLDDRRRRRRARVTARSAITLRSMTMPAFLMPLMNCE